MTLEKCSLFCQGLLDGTSDRPKASTTLIVEDAYGLLYYF